MLPRTGATRTDFLAAMTELAKIQASLFLSPMVYSMLARNEDARHYGA
jgi:hypothetical protein